MKMKMDLQYGCPMQDAHIAFEKAVMPMKKDLGRLLALYPMPLVLVGAMVNGKPTWVLAGHVGIMGHDYMMANEERSLPVL